MNTRLLLILSIFISGCVSQPERTDNVFYLNGKKAVIGDQMLSDIRSRWTGEFQIKASAHLSPEDIRWALDYISLAELINQPKCENYQFINTAHYEKKSDYLNTSDHIRAGLFDYIWVIEVCGFEHRYRVVQAEGSNSFNVYQAKI